MKRWLVALLLASNAAACGRAVIANRGGGEEQGGAGGGVAEDGGSSGLSLGLGGEGNAANLPIGLGYGTTNEVCPIQTACDAVIVGELAGARLNHGFVDSGTPRISSDAFIDLETFVSIDGFLAVRTPDEPLNEDLAVRPLEGGLLRLPSFAGADSETWFCIDGGTSRRATNDRMLLEIDALSSLGTREAATPGDDWLQTDLTETTHAPVEGRFLDLSPLYANLVANGGDASGGQSIEIGFGTDPQLVTDLWRVVGRHPKNDPDVIFTDLILINTQYAIQPWAVAFPGPGSTIAAASPFYVDLQQISAPARCPGTKVEGHLQIHVRMH